MLVVGEVSVVASASVLGLPTEAGVVCWRLPGQALSFYPDLCAGYEPCGYHVGNSVVPPGASGSRRGHGGSPCAWQTLDNSLLSTYPGAWWPLAQHTAANRCSRLQVVHAGSLWAGHACDEIMGEGAGLHVAGAVGGGLSCG